MKASTTVACLCLAVAGCATGPRAGMFDPVSSTVIPTLSLEYDPFIETQPEPVVSIEPVKSRPGTPAGTVSSAARIQVWRNSNPAHGPDPRRLPVSIPLTLEKKVSPQGVGMSANGKSIEARQTSESLANTPDGDHGFVQLMPPPPESEDTPAASSNESRFFELPPAPES